MENEGNKIIPIIGYIAVLIHPIIGLIYGTALFYLKKEVPLYRRHGRLIIYFAIIVFVVTMVIRIMMNGL